MMANERVQSPLIRDSASPAQDSSASPKNTGIQIVASRPGRRAQYSVVYMLAISGIMLFLMGTVFLMTSSFQSATMERFGDELLGSVAAKIETSLIEFKVLSKNANASSANIKIPDLIGEQRYFVTASGNLIELRTFGNPSLVKQVNVTFWNTTLRGSVFSSKGKIRLSYNSSTNIIDFQ